jgi:hypothetical protein
MEGEYPSAEKSGGSTLMGLLESLALIPLRAHLNN